MKALQLRIPDDVYKHVRYISADMECSLNKTIITLLQEAMAGHRVSLPSDLSFQQEPPR